MARRAVLISPIITLLTPLAGRQMDGCRGTKIVTFITAVIFGVVMAAQAEKVSASDGYRVADRIGTPAAALWDYASVDPELRLLFVGRVGGVLLVDLSTRKVTPILLPSKLIHGVALIGDTGTAAATNGLDDSVSIFDEHTGHVLASIATGKEPDGVLFEPKTALLFITNEGSQDATLIDPVALRSVATIPLGGKPEYPAANGEGLIYVNIQSKSEIAVIDVVTRKIVRSIALPGCASPTGLAYDQGDSLLLTVCLNGIALFVDAQSGDIRHSFKIGTKADAAIFDSRRHRAFVSSGGDGALNIFAVRGLKDIALEQTLRTSRGARTLALDPRTGRLYLPSGTRSSFTILVVAPTNEEALSDSAHRPSEAGRH